MSNKSEIDELRAKVNALERQLSGTSTSTEREAAEWANKMHQLRERNASNFNPYTHDQLSAFQEAGRDAQAIVHDHRNAPTGPTSLIPSSSGSSIRGSVGRGSVGGGSGWAHQIPLRNGLGQGK